MVRGGGQLTIRFGHLKRSFPVRLLNGTEFLAGYRGYQACL